MSTCTKCQRGEQAVKPDRPAGRLWRGIPGRRPTGDALVLTTGATASRWRCRTADPPVGAWWRAPLATRPPPQPARQRRGGVAPPAARPRRDRGVQTSGHVPVGEAPSATAGITAPRGGRPSGDTPFATTGAPEPRGRRPTGDAPSVTAGATAPWGVALPATRPQRTGGRQFRGVSHWRCALRHARRNSAAGASPQRRHALCETGGRGLRGVPHRRGAIRPDQCYRPAGPSPHR